jgi:hypothetical protein
VPWGPKDPPIPEQYAAFARASTQDLNCEAVSRMRGQAPFWDLATDVCFALQTNKGWPGTTTVPALPETDAYQTCLNKELAAMLSSALQWHAAHPGRTPVIRYSKSSSTSPCQSRIYGLTVKKDEGKLAVTVLAATPKDDGDLFMTVDGQPDDQDDVQRERPQDGLQEATVLVDPPEQDRDAVVVIDNGRGRLTRKVRLHADTGSSGTPGSSSAPGSSEASPSATGDTEAPGDSDEVTGSSPGSTG